MQWYYQDDEKGQQVPFDENYVSALASDNRVKPTTLVWNETLPGWIPAAEAFPQAYPGVTLPPSAQTPSQPPAAKQSPAQQVESSQQVTTEPTKVKNQDLRELVKDLASYISANRKWMQVFGVVAIIVGVLQALTILGLLVAWVPIWSGILLLKAANSSLVAEKAGTVETLEDALYRIGLFFKINGISVLVFTILYIVAIIGFFVMGGMAALMSGGTVRASRNASGNRDVSRAGTTSTIAPACGPLRRDFSFDSLAICYNEVADFP